MSKFIFSVTGALPGTVRVINAELVRPIHPSYDSGLLQAARSWVYEPARYRGTAVEAEITVEVHLRPPQ